DGHVTGVQTCALPILTVMLVNWFRTATVTPSISHRKTALAVPRARAYIGTSTCWCWRKKSYVSAGHAIPGLTSKDTGAGSAGTRSEERRVGKEVSVWG